MSYNHNELLCHICQDDGKKKVLEKMRTQKNSCIQLLEKIIRHKFYEENIELSHIKEQ